jgi:hypothetical protein
MSGHEDLSAATYPAASQEQSGLSRRSVLRTAAGAGLAATALAATTAAPALAATTRAAGRASAANHGATNHDQASAQVSEPIVVHLRDARTGEIDVFRGTSQTRLHDHALAAALIRASR